MSLLPHRVSLIRPKNQIDSNFKLELKGTEYTYYMYLYKLCSPQPNGRVGRQEFVNFMLSSSLNNDYLSIIWQIIAKTSNDFVTQNEFFMACRLVAYCQNNIEASEESLMRNIPVDRPRFLIAEHHQSNIINQQP